METKYDYIKPLVEIIEIEAETVIASSLDLVEESTDGIARSRERNFWDR